jgi:hypothetical protein
MPRKSYHIIPQIFQQSTLAALRAKVRSNSDKLHKASATKRIARTDEREAFPAKTCHIE